MTTQRRPGGRTAETTKRIFDATLDLLVEGGFAACKFVEISERAQIARATLYRRWDNRGALVIDAVTSRLERVIRAPDNGSFASDLRMLLNQIASFLQSPLGRAILAAAIEDQDQNGTNRRDVWRARFAIVSPIFDRAIERGEVSTHCDREAFLACVVGALYFRIIVMAEPVDHTWVDRILELAQLASN